MNPPFLGQAYSLITTLTEYCGKLKEFNTGVLAGVMNTYAGSERKSPRVLALNNRV